MRLARLFKESKKSQHHVGLFVKLPENLGSKFKRKSEDPSPAHVTNLYLGDQSPDDEDSIVAAAYEIAKKTTPFNVRINGLGYFKHEEENETIAFVKVDSEGLHRLRTRLVKAMKAHGVEWKDSYGGYKPHVTLDYLEYGAKWEGTVPSGSWTCKEIEIWGFDTKHIIKFER